MKTHVSISLVARPPGRIRQMRAVHKVPLKMAIYRWAEPQRPFPGALASLAAVEVGLQWRLLSVGAIASGPFPGGAAQRGHGGL